MNGGTAMGQEASALKSQEEPILPIPSSSATLGVTVVSPEPDTAADVPGGVSSTENAPATVETLEEEFQNLGLEDKEEPILPIPPSSATPGVTVVRPEPDTTAAAAVPGGVSSTENATVETLEEEFQNVGLEDNNKHIGDEDDDLKKDNLDNGDENDDLEVRPRKILYPQRPDAADCAFYLRTGTCGYGSNCRFNHPVRKKNQEQRSTSPESAKVIIEKEKADLLEKMEQQECKYYLRSGGCKFGKACRYNHSREKYVWPPPPPLDFNFLGLPMRPGERECPFYMRTGSCKYGSNCRFHHPDPTAVGGADSTPGSASLHPSGASQPSSTSWSSPSNEQVPFIDAASPYVPIMLPPQRLLPTPEWNGYQASACPPERSLLPPPLVAFNNPTNRTDICLHNQQHMMDEFPERPGQPECSYFMKTGDCKYRSACKFNHPKSRIPSAGALSAMGLPLRPVT